MKLNDLIQWTGTGFVLSMYVVMNLFPELTPWNLIFGLGGAVMYFIWTLRVRNYPQMVINVVAMTLCVLGLIKHFG
jgi:MFS superfamily sulfate permease-like transporter